MRKTLLQINGLLPLVLALALALVFWLPAGAVRAAANPPQERMTATVIEFSLRGDLNEQAGAIIADLMMSAIANTGRFTLKDRLPLSATGYRCRPLPRSPKPKNWVQPVCSTPRPLPNSAVCMESMP